MADIELQNRVKETISPFLKSDAKLMTLRLPPKDVWYAAYRYSTAWCKKFTEIFNYIKGIAPRVMVKDMDPVLNRTVSHNVLFEFPSMKNAVRAAFKILEEAGK